MRAQRSTVGSSDGNIIAAIIGTQIATNQPSEPRSVPGPSSIPLMRNALTTQATRAIASRAAAVQIGSNSPSGERGSAGSGSLTNSNMATTSSEDLEL